MASDEGLNRCDETRAGRVPAAALTWQQWLQSKRASGRGNATNNTVEEKTDLLALGAGQEEHAGPCTQTHEIKPVCSTVSRGTQMEKDTELNNELVALLHSNE